MVLIYKKKFITQFFKLEIAPPKSKQKKNKPTLQKISQKSSPNEHKFWKTEFYVHHETLF